MRYKKQALSMAAVAYLILFAVIGGNMNAVEPYALVSIDINPSLEITIDDNQDVIEIMPLNSEAYDVFDEDMIGENIMYVLGDIIDKADENDYLSKKNNNILISSVTYDEDDADDFSDEIRNFLEENLEPSENIRVIYIESDLETVEEAKVNQVSIGKQVVNNLKDKQDKSDNDEESEDILEANVVLDDLDDLEDAYLGFIERLMLVPDTAEDYNVIEAFLSDIEELDKDDNNIPTEYLDEYPSLVLMKNRARDIWRLFQKDYQELWAKSQGDEADEADEPEDVDEPEDPEDLEDLYSFVSRLHFAKMAGAEGFEDFLDDHFIYDPASETYTLDYDSLDEGEKPSDLLREAKSHWDPIKHQYQKDWGKAQESDEDESDDPEDEDTSEDLPWDSQLALEEDQDLQEWLEVLLANEDTNSFAIEYESDLKDAEEEQTFRDLKIEVKEKFMSLKEKGNSNKPDNKNKGKKN
ncbi:hypothetical protein EZV73_19845 [Acidaminobacter sp. JC074]|uniref:anti-sigma-I factor RsgI family protein n=1 Tax=Acidaminobacter sp. JC074 TaxID=2530199 RepID=UPI001F0E98DC|nr:hypothetical protein [Acidaminobacter sp. JC074]MCH4889846.1 hypothetical protein [Acidaminobacter sp. JC074]